VRTPLNASSDSEMIVQDERVDDRRRAPARKYAPADQTDSGHASVECRHRPPRHAGKWKPAISKFRRSVFTAAALVNSATYGLESAGNGIDLGDPRAGRPAEHITGEPRAFKQTLLNLVSNASSSPSAADTSRSRPRSRDRAGAARQRLPASASGAEDLQRIGDRFPGRHHLSAQPTTGTGLGIVDRKELVALHSGK